MLERIQKILSARGIASRRKAEEYITQGLVKVNGKVATLGQKADPEADTIEVDGQVLQARQEMLYYLMYKPVGVETSNVERGKEHSKHSSTPVPSTPPTVRDLLPPDLRGKVYPVGRLDKDSEGLLLFTNDGVLAYRLTHPKFDHEKEYEVTTDQAITEGQLRKLTEGITLSGEKTKKATIKCAAPNVFHITLTEGKYRQIRRMVQKVGRTVVKLVRIRVMTLTDHRLQPGALRALTEAEKSALLHSIDVE